MAPISSFPRALLVLALATLSAACVTAVEPCSTHCSDIAGVYELVAGATTVESGGDHPQLCNEITYAGETVEVVIEQSGSLIRLSGYLAMQGTLYEDDTIGFNRVDFGDTPVGPVTARISGHFAPENGVKIIKGRLRFEVEEYDCEVWSVLTLTEI